MVTHYEFLASLHELLQPRTYLEVGVQAGGSLNLARCPAIGIDPAPLVEATGQQRIFSMTSDEYFSNYHPGEIDLAYIDGMHLFEFALRDFLNVQRFMSPQGVVVIDDVLPYNAAIAERAQPPGDWAGDVWKLISIFDEYLECWDALVDVSPTGALVIRNVDPADVRYLTERYDEVVERYLDRSVPDWVLERNFTDPPERVLRDLRESL